jgi:hypothetical protein
VTRSSLYRRLLHTTAGKKTLARALAFLAGGGTWQQLEAWLFASLDYFQRRAGGSGAGFLQAIFHDVLDQAPDPRTVLAVGGMLVDAASRLEAATILLQSVPADVRWVAAQYRQFMHSLPDPKTVGRYVNLLRRGVRDKVVLADLLTSPEYFGQV